MSVLSHSISTSQFIRVEKSLCFPVASNGIYVVDKCPLERFVKKNSDKEEVETLAIASRLSRYRTICQSLFIWQTELLSLVVCVCVDKFVIYFYWFRMDWLNRSDAWSLKETPRGWQLRSLLVTNHMLHWLLYTHLYTFLPPFIHDLQFTNIEIDCIRSEFAQCVSVCVYALARISSNWCGMFEIWKFNWNEFTTNGTL